MVHTRIKILFLLEFMANLKTFLFISLDGMTDALGQSQVIPYLVGLSEKGNKIELVSCEKKENWNLKHVEIESILNKANIKWHYSFYKTGKPFISQIQNYLALKQIVINRIKKNSNSFVIHCRSYLPGLIGLSAKKKYNTGFIFDMRGFWADEKTEGGIWKKSNPISLSIYSYFKKKEKEMLLDADAIISLTHKAKSIILDWNIGIPSEKITVIPCCVDLEHFSKEKLNTSHLSVITHKHPQLKDKFVLSYVGSLGTWYMANEMMAFFKTLSEKTDAEFLIITKDSEALVQKAAKKIGVPLNKITVISSSREDMPYYISLSTASLFFIKPTFSKLASSPTKMGELLSMEVPIITNEGIGDVSETIRDSNCGVIITDFNNNAYQKAVQEILEGKNQFLKNTLTTAKKYFSLADGVEKYNHIYNLFK